MFLGQGGLSVRECRADSKNALDSALGVDMRCSRRILKHHRHALQFAVKGELAVLPPASTISRSQTMSENLESNLRGLAGGLPLLGRLVVAHSGEIAEASSTDEGEQVGWLEVAAGCCWTAQMALRRILAY